MSVIRVNSARLIALWETVLPGHTFDENALANQCETDGGYDFSGAGLTKSDITAVISPTGFSGETSALSFCCSEILAYYSANAAELSAMQVVSFAFNASLAWRLAKLGHLDWEMKVDDVFCVLCHIRQKSTETLLQATYCIFGAEPQGDWGGCVT